MRQVKAFFPNFGLKLGDLNTYIFFWLSYTKQRKLDKLIHFLACVKEKCPFKQFQLPQVQICSYAATKEGTFGDNAIVIDLKDNVFENINDLCIVLCCTFIWVC